MEQLIQILANGNMGNPVVIAQLVALSGSLSIVTEVLKKLPKVPVNSDNATVVILVLAAMSVLTLAYLNNGLTLSNADAIVGVTTVTFGLGVGLYKLVKPVVQWVKGSLTKK